MGKLDVRAAAAQLPEDSAAAKALTFEDVPDIEVKELAELEESLE